MSSHTSSPNLTPTTSRAPTQQQSPQMSPYPQRTSSINRRRGISRVRTEFLPTITAAPTLPMSASSVTTSSSVQVSPIMSPEIHQIMTSNSSLQVSPEGPRGREPEHRIPPFEPLPESVCPTVSKKPSQTAMAETFTSNRSQGLMRRLSNKISRRQSTAASRDQSAGPVMLRRRSDSTNTAPDSRYNVVNSDSDEDVHENAIECVVDSPLSIEGAGGDYPSSSASFACSSTMTGGGNAGLAFGPVIPTILLQGTTMIKITKKKRKLLTFVLEDEACKVSWDKTRPAKSFLIDNVQEIRLGSDALNYREEFKVDSQDEPRFFSILYVVPDIKSNGRSTKIMHLIALDEQAFDLWTTTLDAISKHRQDNMSNLTSFNDKAVENYWRNEMSKQFSETPHAEDEEALNFEGVEQLCKNLHINTSSRFLRERFQQVDTTKSKKLNFAEFQEFVKLMKRRGDVSEIYKKLASDPTKGLTLEEFINFIGRVQAENVEKDRAKWESIFAKATRRSRSRDQPLQEGEVARMSEEALATFLTSTHNVPLETVPETFSLDRPIHEYFISSSHNTYLMGRQVAGESSVEAYISALIKGCRCVEIDCWDGKDGRPIVNHGHTMTRPIMFSDVMYTIAKYAFVKSHFPLWISLEVHCNDAQQAAMAQIIKEACGAALVTEPLDSSSQELPSPSQLMDRILIKVKKPRILAETPSKANGRSRGNSLSSPRVYPTQLDNSSISSGSLPPPPNLISSGSNIKQNIRRTGTDGITSSSSSDSEGNEDRPKDKPKTSKIVQVLGELGIYSVGVKFRGFDDPDSKAYNHIFSFMESTFDRNSKTQVDRRAMTRHNMRYLMRVYPNGWRVASTNFDPLKYWRRSVQMVALNWQTHDLGMQMNDAMFAGGTDQSGYVLKPSELREIKMLPSVPEEAGANHVKRERKNVNFSIDIISAQQLMRPKGLPSNRSVDPYVEVEVYHADDKSKETKGVIGEGGLDASAKDGSSGLGAPHKRRTHIVQENGFNPAFNKKFNFALTTKFPELVFVRWTVRCSSDGHSYNVKTLPLATYTAKLSSLKQGYRTLPLYDTNGDQFLFSTLFCRVKIDAATSIYVNAEANESVSVLKSLGRTVFNRTPLSPRPSVDSGHQ
ncbi:BcPLC1, phosphoinositide-specific phospholipase C [Sclerotinia borealis F-4128]|uniref:Phosphoinositide phospholipase C n=1 Tax=Sclerotinia borealis (strain F-4128) TaxID=1432307 RepID=W9CPP0_SCLBF|nr:BcPLC1, phosphoinositide-specific phospholipase C [Sclerotinia borealis F-4128]